MTKDELIALKKEIASLSELDEKERNLYLRGLANGDIQGPPVGYSSIDKPWLNNYTEDEIQFDIPKKSIYSFMKEMTKDFDDLDALGYFNVNITFKEFKEKVEEVKKSLVEVGVKQGDIVSVCLPNMPEVGYIFYALNDLGAVANMLDPRTNKSTQESNVNDAKSDLVITLDSVADSFIGTNAKQIVSISALNSLSIFLQSIIKIFDKSMNIKLPNDSRIINYPDFIRLGKRKKNVPSAAYIENSPAVIAYTGGTTGAPKGVVVTNEAFNAMIIENKAVHYDADPKDNALGMAPPWTYYGLSNSFNAYLCLGVKIELLPRFGPDDLGKLILKHKANHVETVPSALIGLMNEPKIKNKDLSYIRTIIVGADKLSEKTEKEINQFLTKHNSSAKVTKGYGMTEVCAAAAYTLGNTNSLSTVGIPLLLENISVFAIDDFDKELLTGERGEVCIKGPKSMVGYFGSFENQTNQVLKTHSDGSVWAHTGDIGHMDKDGKLYIDGRIKRMFVKNGFKIFPGEIETQILKHPDIEQAAVIGVDDESYGYITIGYIVPSKETIKDESELIAEVNNTLTKSLYDYEIPDSINIINQLPLTQMNKIDYRKLQEIYSKSQKQYSRKK